MSGHLTLVTEYTIKPGRLEDFRRLVRTEFVPQFREAEAGLRLYQWYEHPDGTRAYQQSWYADGDDFIAHMRAAVVSERFARLLETCEVTRVEVFGDPSPAAERYLAEQGMVVHRHLAGFGRTI